MSNDRFNWKVRPSARYLFGGTDTILIDVQPWGAPPTVRLAPKRRCYLTNTFSFQSQPPESPRPSCKPPTSPARSSSPS